MKIRLNVISTERLLTTFTCLNICHHCKVLFALQQWNDYNLAWNASDFSGVQSIRVPPTMIWKPDVLMYNR